MLRRIFVGAFIPLWISSCGSSAVTQQNSPGSSQTLSAAAQLGGQIFTDKNLSVSGQQSCATCHVAQFAFASNSTVTGPDHGLPVPLGGANMDEPGFRNTPSLMYLSFAPDFFFD